MTRAKHSDLPLWTVLGRNLENQDNASNLLTALAPSQLFNDKYAHLH